MMAGRVVRIGLPVVAVAAVLGGGGWMLASQQSAEAAPGKAAARPAISASKYDRVSASGNVFYKVPAGYKAVQTKGSVIMVRQADIANGDFNGYLLLTDGFTLNAATKARFEAAGKPEAVKALAIAAGGLESDPDAKLSAPQLVNDPAADGYEGYLLVSQSQDKDAGKTRFAQYAVFLVGDRAEVAMRVAYGSSKALEALGTDFDALLKVMEFRNAGAPPPARLAAALPTDLASITPKQVKSGSSSAQASGNAASGAGVVCRVETQYRTFFGNMAGGMPTATRYPVTQRICRRNGQIVE